MRVRLSGPLRKAGNLNTTSVDFLKWSYPGHSLCRTNNLLLFLPVNSVPNPWGSWARLTEPWYRWPFSSIRELFLQNMYFHLQMIRRYKMSSFISNIRRFFSFWKLFYLRLQTYWPAAESCCWLVLFFPSLTFTFCKNSELMACEIFYALVKPERRKDIEGVVMAWIWHELSSHDLNQVPDRQLSNQTSSRQAEYTHQSQIVTLKGQFYDMHG